MCVIRVGGEETEYLSINVLSRSHPGAVDYWDGNWLRVEIAVVAGGFRGRTMADIRAEELVAFGNELSRLLDTLQGSAEFHSLERPLAMSITSDRRGHLTLAGEIRDEPGIGNSLTFTLEYDQTYFRPMLDGVLDAIVRFPVVGQQPR